MKKLFDYCFYRIALFYKKRLPLENYIRQGHSVLIIAIAFYLLSITVLVLSYFNLNVNIAIAMVLLVPSCFILFFIEKIFPNSQLLFEEKSKQYQNEKHKWLKGSLIFLFLIFSFFSMFIVYFIVKY